MVHVKDWGTLKKLTAKLLAVKKLREPYISKLKFELKEIDKQGANRYWLDLFNSREKFNHNKNGLVLPYILGLTKIDPIDRGIPHKVEYHPDFPDIDIDFLPEAREHVKKYAKKQYGDDFVCTVGMWIRYKTKLALQDAATALGVNRGEVIAVCKHLPEEFDTMPFDQAYEEFENFKIFADENPELVRLAYGMTGKIKAQSKHAGGLIISSVPIRDHVPLTYSGKKGDKQWTSEWTEGMADSQLSKFGLVKFDILGLINIAYIWNCKKLVAKNHGVKIDFEDIDPEDDRAGWAEYADGRVEKILLNDPDTLEAADNLKLASIFQFDTDFQQSVVEKGGVRSFMDLVIYTSLGRPGPLPMIDVYIGNRDDQLEGWNDVLHPIMKDILKETKGVLTFQEQLLRTWTELCGFTMPEAESAQKAVKKKRIEILDKIGPKVIEGAAGLIGQDEAEALWDKMVSFGRYCFNKCLASDTIIIDPLTNESMTIEELYQSKKSFNLLSYDGNKPFIDEVVDVYYNGKQEVFEIEFSHGIKQTVTIGHKFMNEFGEMEEVSSLLESGHAIKYIRDGVINVQESKRSNRTENCRALSKQVDLQSNFERDRNKIEPWDDNSSDKKTRREEEILNQSMQHSGSPLFREYKFFGESLLVGHVDSRWLYSRGKRICELATSSQRPKLSKEIWRRFEVAKKNIDLSKRRFYTNAEYGKQQEDDCGFETSWCHTREVYQGNYSGRSIHVTPIKGVDGWGRMYCGQFERVPNDKTWVEFCLFRESENHFSFRMWGEGFKDYGISKQFLCYLLDWFVSDPGDTEVFVSRCHKISAKEKANGRCNIVSIRNLGVKKTYSPEMTSDHHNYLTKPQNGEVVHANSHAVAYIMVAYRCLWLKTYYPAEWWASVLSHCPAHKFVRYMGAARTDKIAFGTLDVDNLTKDFTVQKGSIIPGLSSIKGIGDETAQNLEDESAKGTFEGIEEFIERCGKSKANLERLVKLGAFDNINPNRKALWMWYLYKYATGKEITELRRQIDYCYTWSPLAVQEERDRQKIEYKRQYQNRKIPKRITTWIPAAPSVTPRVFNPDVELTKEDIRLGKKFKLDYEQVVALFPTDFKLAERLEAEHDYLGFYWSSPLDMFQHSDNTTIEFAKTCGLIECVIEEKFVRQGTNGEYCILNVNDGQATARVNVWGNEVHLNDPEVLQPGTGVQMEVIWKDQYRSFSLKARSIIIPLPFKEEDEDDTYFKELSKATTSGSDELDELKEMLENIDDLERDFNEAE
tara:strand:- start:81691 stop:85476 length:3786 start_codon:yes stop_codon:yes gene_type:complete